jgi:hypothetical protein
MHSYAVGEWVPHISGRFQPGDVGKQDARLAETAKTLYTNSLMRVVKLFSADVTLDPLALAPAKPLTVAVYSPSDSSTLPEYCLPPTVVV